METRKLKEKVLEIKTQNCSEEAASNFCPSTKDPPESSSKRKKKKKEKEMHMEIKEKLVSKRPKSLKSVDKQVSSSKSKKSGSITRKRTRYTDIYDDIEAKFSVMERAERVLTGLASQVPSFVKCMLPSNVAHGFWLHLPKRFCSLHLPNHDTTITLVDEWGNEYKTSYLLDRHGLSAGWRGFSISHRLLKGDILIFHLIEPCKLQVHIVRVNSSDVVDAALCLLNMDACRKGTDSDIAKKDNKKRKKTKYVEPFHTSMQLDSSQSKDKDVLNSDQFESNSDQFGSQDLQGSELTNRLQSSDLYGLDQSFLCKHPHEAVTCR